MSPDVRDKWGIGGTSHAINPPPEEIAKDLGITWEDNPDLMEELYATWEADQINSK